MPCNFCRHIVADLPVLNALRTFLYFLIAGVATLPFFLALPMLVFPMRFGWPIITSCLKMHLFFLKIICGLSYRISGQENLPDTPYLISSQHESVWETLFFHLVFDNPAMFAKEELFRLPLVGLLMKKNGHIRTDRGGSIDKLRAAMRQAHTVSSNGRNVLIFPGGTRDADAKNVIRKGVSILYRKLKCPCVPVVLNTGLFWPSGTWVKHPGTIHVWILPAIDPGLSSEEFITRLSPAMASPA